ncbi:MAG TPA: globin domain-containing protein [Methyloceanibacter sp.]|jgi:hemoglobin-like flavoprotein|nr:globin domain-containing protein [Methyloceanibacter sp.]
MSAVLEARAAKSTNRAAQSRAGDAQISLTAAQKRLIRESFVKLEPALDLVGQLFYLKLYRLDPSLRESFGGDSKSLGRKFMAAVKLTIIALKHEDGLTPTLKLLGVRQRQLGMKVRDYRTMAKAWTWTLERSLEKSFTRQSKDAWAVLLAQVTRVLSGSDAALLRSVS